MTHQDDLLREQYVIPPYISFEFQRLPAATSTFEETHDMFYTRTLYAQLPPSMEAADRLVGTTIVASVNFMTDSGRSPSAWGDYAAYIGAGAGSMDAGHCAEYVRRNGSKIQKELAELIFRPILDRVYGVGVIRWRE